MRVMDGCNVKHVNVCLEGLIYSQEITRVKRRIFVSWRMLSILSSWWNINTKAVSHLKNEMKQQTEGWKTKFKAKQNTDCFLLLKSTEKEGRLQKCNNDTSERGNAVMKHLSVCLLLSNFNPDWQTLRKETGFVKEKEEIIKKILHFLLPANI